MKRKKPPEQSSLFPDANTVSLDEFKKGAKKRQQHEKKFMESVREVAASLGLPSVHIRNYCGNRSRCPSCGTTVTCHNILNKNLKGMHDIIGVSWTIETKHKTNKVKPQSPKPTLHQSLHSSLYSLYGVPSLIVNEDGFSEAYNFLKQIAEGRSQ
jgi:ferredoxin